MPTAEELKARFENRVRPGPTDDRLVASLGLMPAPPEPEPKPEPSDVGADAEPTRPKRAPGNGKGRRQPVRLVAAVNTDSETAASDTAEPTEEATPSEQKTDGGGVGLEAVAELFPPPPLLAAAGPEPVKVGFPVPVDLIRDVTRLKVDLSRRLGRRLSNHEIGAAATQLVPGDPAQVADLVRSHAERLGLGETGPSPRRRLVADIPPDAANGLEDLVLAIDGSENVRVTKSQLWALAHVLLLERAGR